MRCYFPMTANILTRGHIECLKYLENKGEIVVGLLTRKGLEGYKREVTPYKDRKYILENLNIKLKVAPQDSLNPLSNIKKYKCQAIASGDGFERDEMDAINKLGLEIINIKLRGEKTKRYSSSQILNEYTSNKERC
jgi:glycerol-3-phosphate cytidylyltransferase-like family protein